MANVKRFDREEAVRLREQGMGYDEISTTLGCSYAWCAKELRGVGKGDAASGVGAEVKQATKESVIAVLEDALAKVRAL